MNPLISDMSDPEAFLLIGSSTESKIYEEYEKIKSAPAYDLNTTIQAALRRQYPELNLTVTPEKSVNLLRFAAVGNATAELDISTDSVSRTRYFYSGSVRSGISDQLTETRDFAKYQYRWASEDFIVYVVYINPFVGSMYYILKKPGEGETTMSHCAATDALIYAIGESTAVHDENFIYVYDYGWRTSRVLWAEVQKVRWEDVILNEQMKNALTELITKFFDSMITTVRLQGSIYLLSLGKEIYEDLGVPWKVGLCARKASKHSQLKGLCLQSRLFPLSCCPKSFPHDIF